VDVAPEDSASCAVCDRRVAEVDGGADWLHLEITRGDSPDDFEYIDADFCTQAHAAEWLSGPLPTPEPTASVPADRRERFFALLLGFCVLWSVGLMGLGAYALVRLLGGWT
jgi:hypothetical protein